MATNHDSTTIRGMPAHSRQIICNPETGEHTMYLDGEPIGYARTSQQAKVTLDALLAETFTHKNAAIIDTLVTLNRLSGDTPVFRDACTHLLADVEIEVVDNGAAYRIDGLRIQPEPACFGWPWRCQCGEAHCWHAALCEALVMVQSEDNGAAVVVIVVREA